MLRRNVMWGAPLRDPFRILGLTRTASKSEVKMKYRELARLHHPDASSGDSAKMEEINHAYKLLMKEGGYERLHLSTSGSSAKNSRAGPVPPTGFGPRDERPGGDAPFSSEQHDAAGEQPVRGLTDEEVEIISALDPFTERRTQAGKFKYQNRNDGSWVELDRPLLKANQPRYPSYAEKSDMAAELRRRAQKTERAQNEKTAFERSVDRLMDSGDLPTRNRHLLRLYIVIVAIVFYFMYDKTFARSHHHRQRHSFYQELEEDRTLLTNIYEENRESFEVAMIAATLIYLAASAEKQVEDPVVSPNPEVFYRSVRPPPQHFHVISGV